MILLDLHRLFLEKSFNSFVVRLDEIGVKTIADKSYFVKLLALDKKYSPTLLKQKQFLDGSLPTIIQQNKKTILEKMPKYVLFSNIMMKHLTLYKETIAILDNYFGDKKVITINHNKIFFELFLQGEGDLAQLQFLRSVNPALKTEFVYYFWND